MLLPASSILEVQYSAASGKVEVTYLRFRRFIVEKDANGGEVTVPEVYVITPTTWERWQEIDGKWQRTSTKQRDIKKAIEVAKDLYKEAHWKKKNQVS